MACFWQCYTFSIHSASGHLGPAALRKGNNPTALAWCQQWNSIRGFVGRELSLNTSLHDARKCYPVEGTERYRANQNAACDFWLFKYIFSAMVSGPRAGKLG